MLAASSKRRVVSVVLAVALCVPSAIAASPAEAAASPTTAFRITGGGWGHGIGLSQFGAKGYAEKGWPHADILRWYFGGDRTGVRSGVKVATLASLGKYANPTVKVNVDSATGTRTSWVLRGWKTKLRVTDETTAAPLYLTSDAYQTFTVSGGKVSVGGRKFTGTVRVRSVIASGVPTPLIVVKSESGPFDRTYIRYRGEIQLKVLNGRLRAVNALPLEEYLYGVVPRESPSSWHIEALKAQAVAARSYAWGTNPPSSSSSSSLGGILHCTTSSQVYGGHSRLVAGSNTNITLYETANAAVSATRGQVVYHTASKKIVTTYFSSSSGGHTANIEDVWIPATPQPYYRGVKDADQGGPDYTWGPIVKTASELAEALRKKDMADGRREYSVAAPAYITAVSHEKASSGFVRHVTFRWSTGAAYTLRGDTVRNILGLKSSKFQISGPTWGPVIQETDPRIAWSGDWGTWRSTAHSGGAYRYSWLKGAQADFKFSGSGFRWFAVKWPKGGRAEVLIDGKRVAIVSLYAPRTTYRQIAYTATGLSVQGSHTATIRVLRTKDASSTGFAVGVDAVRIEAGQIATATPTLP